MQAAIQASWLVVLLPLPLTLAATVTDLRARIIPDRLNLGLFGLGLALAAWADPAPAAIAARLAEAGLAAGLFWSLRALHAHLRGRIGLGLGDVKFIGTAAVWTGLAGLPLLILVASTAALAAVGLAALAGRRVAATDRLPFGPFLALGLHAALLAGGA
ncbi:prepilin peptidase [Methylobacterium oryzisoli]|uniref:prepilin peptidase n=1 Tax=Methylobacterium oryzisoli TaxID=3385502 RepID=UPI0038918742